MPTYNACRNLLTPHRTSSYAGITLYLPSADWPVAFLCPKVGDAFVAMGGEYAVGYETLSGAHVDGFVLNAGDRASVVRWDGDTFLAEWRVERANA
jgi:hypothetical protein